MHYGEKWKADDRTRRIRKKNEKGAEEAVVKCPFGESYLYIIYT